MKKFVWMEEYKTCHCSDIKTRRKDFLGYCRKHGFDKSIIVKFPVHIFANKKNKGV